MQPARQEDEERENRALAAADIAGLAIARNLPHLAATAAREAARATLLVVAADPRRPSTADADILRSMAAFPVHGAPASSGARGNMVRATLEVVDRLVLTRMDLHAEGARPNRPPPP